MTTPSSIIINPMIKIMSSLAGTWTGNNGVNLIAVPDQKGSFKLLIAPYTETLTFTALPAATPDRGYSTIEQILALSYNTTILNSKDNSLMHAENGFLEFIDPAANDGFNIFRLATIPHGNSVQAMGKSSIIQGPPTFDTSMGTKPFNNLPSDDGYDDVYDDPTGIPGYATSSPNQYLADHLNQQIAAGYTVSSTAILQISTQNNGGIQNIPCVGDSAETLSKVNTTQFDASFWIETLQKGSETLMQLQYSQRILITFPMSSNQPGQTITWPHVNVNTLTLASS